MGLDTTHNCWHGGYIYFMHWRKAIARAAGLPPLEAMENFFDGQKFAKHKSLLPDVLVFLWPDAIMDDLPIRWEALRPDVLHELLNHSDYDGKLPAAICAPLADRLAELLPILPEAWNDLTVQFIEGLRVAASRNEDVEFH